MARTKTLSVLFLILACLFSFAVLRQALAGELPAKLVGHGGPIKSITLSADARHALTASFDYSIIHWELDGEEGKAIHRLVGHEGAVNDVAFVPAQAKAVSVSDDGSLAIWNLDTGKLIVRIPSTPHKVLGVAVSPDGRTAAAARWDGTVRLYGLAEKSENTVLKGHRGNVNSVVFSRDGTRLYSAANDGQIIEWNIAEKKIVRPVHRHGWGINSIALLDGNRLIFGALDGTVGIVDPDRDETPVILTKRDSPVLTVTHSKDGELFGYGDGAGRIEVFGTDDLKSRLATEVTYGPVFDFDFIPGKPELYHAGLDDFAIHWQVLPPKISKIESTHPRRFQVRASDDPGEIEFRRKCSVCHTLTPKDANRAGPTLYKVFGRRAGELPGYPYSKTLLSSDVVWNEDTIAQLFDEGPDIMMPGTKMPMQQLKSVTRRDDLIRFLKAATAERK